MLVRTEEDIVSKRPFQVALGDLKYPIKPLPIPAQREWRDNLNMRLHPVLESFKGPDMQAALAGGLAMALVRFPKEIEDLVFMYAPELLDHKDVIMETATEEQFATAFSAIMVVAYPYLPQLTTVTQLWRSSK